jgi:hypothetical protein
LALKSNGNIILGSKKERRLDLPGIDKDSFKVYSKVAWLSLMFVLALPRGKVTAN